MNCPKCGSWSSVLDTRDAPNHMIKRRRQCGNGHKFPTFEVLGPVITRHDATMAANAASKRAAKWRRNIEIAKATGTHKEIGAAFGLVASRIAAIRAEQKSFHLQANNI